MVQTPCTVLFSTVSLNVWAMIECVEVLDGMKYVNCVAMEEAIFSVLSLLSLRHLFRSRPTAGAYAGSKRVITPLLANLANLQSRRHIDRLIFAVGEMFTLSMKWTTVSAPQPNTLVHITLHPSRDTTPPD